MKKNFLLISFLIFFIQCSWDERIGEYDGYEPYDSIPTNKHIIKGDTTNVDSIKNTECPITFNATVDDYTNEDNEIK